MRKFFIAAAVAVAAMLGSTSSAEATFQMRLTSTVGGVTTTTITDTDGDGVIDFTGPFGGWILSLHSGLSKPALGTPAVPHMDLTFRAQSTAAGTLTVEISDQGFITSPLPVGTTIGGTLSGAISSVKAEAGFDNANALFAIANPAPYSQTLTGSPFGGSGGFTITGGTPYSLTERITITATGAGGLASGDFELQSSPAPAGLVLALVGMPVFGLGAFIRRRRTVTA